MRQAVEDKEEAKSLKQKTRERVCWGGLLLGVKKPSLMFSGLGSNPNQRDCMVWAWDCIV